MTTRVIRTVISTMMAAAFALICSTTLHAQRWDRENGKPAPALIPAGWSGSPVSLDVLKKCHTDLGEGAAEGATVAEQVGASGGPSITPVTVSPSSPSIALQSPKSVRRITPRSLTITLLGFRSRWISPCWCA